MATIQKITQVRMTRYDDTDQVRFVFHWVDTDGASGQTYAMADADGKLGPHGTALYWRAVREGASLVADGFGHPDAAPFPAALHI